MAKKHAPRKLSLEEGVALLAQRYRGKLAPPLEGLDYRFTIWLPVLAQGRPVFTPQHRIILLRFFHDCFGGLSQTSIEGFPPWSGSWLPEGTNEPIVDHHILLVVYTRQDAEALVCMQQLKWVLQQDQVAAQQVVLVEKLPVHLIEAVELH